MGVDAWWMDATEPSFRDGFTQLKQEERTKSAGKTYLGSFHRYLNTYSLEMLKDFYSRELRRVLGMSKFDYAVIFTSKKKFFPVLSGKLDVKKVYGAKNWQKVLEIPE